MKTDGHDAAPAAQPRISADQAALRRLSAAPGSPASLLVESPRGFWGMTAYQWLVVFAAWLGWGFDVFDAVLFNYVSRLCVPDLLNLDPGAPGRDHTINVWTGALTSLLLVGWGLGGILFGKVTDRLGRTRTLMITMLTYSLGTAACAFAPNIWVLAAFRFIAALGIGGEWSAGAALVAETVPNSKRVIAGALLQTASAAGLFMATFVNDLFTRQIDAVAGDPNFAWRMVFLAGLAPAVVAMGIRLTLREPPLWKPHEGRPRVRELFTPELRRKTIGGLAVASIMVLAWWCCASFLPRIVGLLASNAGLPAPEQARYITVAQTAFSTGGLVGALLIIPIALHLGRRAVFLIYFASAAASIYAAFGVDMANETRLRLMFFVGMFVNGSFGALPFYLPELFPMRLRGTGSGFCYNVGRFIAAAGPFAVPAFAGWVGADLRTVVSWAAVFPLIGVALVLSGVTHETRHERLDAAEPA